MQRGGLPTDYFKTENSMKVNLLIVVLAAWCGTAVFVTAVQNDAAKFPGDGDIVIADFEQGGYGADWTAEGTAFGEGPVRSNLPGCAAASGFLGRGLADSRLGGDASQGCLTSPEITVVRNHIRFLVAGASSAGKVGINLIYDGRVVRSSMGPTRMFYVLQPDEWDVSEFLGKKVRIQIIDHSSEWMGHVLVDQIVQSDIASIQVNPHRELAAGGKYLLLPVSDQGTFWANITLSSGNEVVRKLSLALAADKPDWWAFVYIPNHSGTPLRVEIDKLPAGSKGLENIAASSDITGCTPYSDPARPQFHYTPRCGYMGDANGLVYHEGVWHLFYQHSPFSRSLTFSVLNWGHAASRDLIHWEEQSDALPSACNERIFMSGSAVIDKNNTSGFGTNAMVAFSSSGGESLFYSTDTGQTFKVWERNPVLNHAGRDPRVFWYKPGSHWVMIVYDETGGKQRNAIYTSPDLKQWTFQSAVDGFYECPDLFELPVDGNPDETVWLMFGCDNQYLSGKFDGKTFTPDSGSPKLKGSHGWYFYAGQTFNDAPAGRRIQMGCLKVDYRNVSFDHAMSVPLELTLRRTEDGVKLYSWPVRELEQLRENRIHFPDITLRNREMPVPGMNADLKDINIEFTIPSGAATVGIKVGGIPVTFDAKMNELICRDVRAPLHPADGKIRLRVLADRGILEIFAGDGRVYMPVAVPVLSEPGGVSLFAQGDRTVKADLVICEMRPPRSR
jgi:fructan beta-fructosidase